MRIVVLLILCGCHHIEYVRIPVTNDKHVEDRYSHVSDSAPASLRPFYDPELTRALNR